MLPILGAVGAALCAAFSLVSDSLPIRSQISLPRQIPSEIAARLRIIPDKARSMGINIQAGRGSGKSRLLGRIIAWQDALRGVPVIIFDPTGSAIDNFIDKLIRLPQPQRDAVATRILYLDMSGLSGSVARFPLYYRLGAESLYTVAQRFIDIIRISDPDLLSASIQGFNSVYRIGTLTGMILYALGYGITEASDLLNQPEKWKPLFGRAITAYPEVRPAIEFFEQEYLPLPKTERKARTDSFMTKILQFSLDPTSRSMFGSVTSDVAWKQIIEEQKIVLLDFRHEMDVERKRFKMLWVFTSILDYLKDRGPGKSRQPLSVIIDELSSLLNFSSMASSEAFAQQFEEVINVISRNYNLWMCTAFQELFEIPERLQKTLLTCGTLIFGSGSDAEAAEKVAHTLFEYDPFLVKRFEAVYAQSFGTVRVVDHRPVEYTIDEQNVLRSYTLMKQPRFCFLCRLAHDEGDIHGPLQPISIENFDKGQWVQEQKVTKARSILASRSGRPIPEILAEIDERRRGLKVPPTQPVKSATMKKYGTAKNLSPAPTHATPQETTDDEELY